MGNRNTNHTKSKAVFIKDCKILILGGKCSGKTTLFSKIIDRFTSYSSQEVQQFFFEQILSQTFYVTLKVAKSCKREEFKNRERLKKLLGIESNPSVENLQKFKKEICSIWEEKVLIKKFESKQGFQYENNDE
jgi:hypothetical protein